MITSSERAVLKFLSSVPEATAASIGSVVWPNLSSARSRSGASAQTAWELIRKGLVSRRLKRRELYLYSITDAGRREIVP